MRKPRRKFGPSQKDRLFLACLPDAETAARIYALAEDLKRDQMLEGTLTRAEHLHVTLFHLGDWRGLPDLIAESAHVAAKAVAATEPFDATFDHAQSLRNSTGVYPFVLLGSDGPTLLHRFRESLGKALAQNGLGGAVRDSEFRPHVTLSRGAHRVGRVPIVPPISWSVREFVLVHSLLGRTTHVHLARWPLGALAETVRTRMATTVYGIKNCDTMKKARAWLEAHKVAYDFHDYKIAGIAKPKLEGWVRAQGWEVLLNRAGQTFRKLADKEKENIDGRKAVTLMLAQPSMIKRPVIETGGKLLVGFNPELYAKAFAARR